MNKMVLSIIENLVKIESRQTGAMQAFRQGLEAGIIHNAIPKDLAELLAGLEKAGVSSKSSAFKEIFGLQISRAGNVAEAAVKESEVAIKTGKTLKAEVNAVKVKNEAYRVTPPKAQTVEERKISKIKELMQPEKEAYEATNLAYMTAQKAQIEKFHSYVDGYTKKYAELITKLENAKTEQEVAVIKNQLEKLEKQAKITMTVRLKKVGTLSDAEVTSKVNEAQELAKTKAQNLTYATATTAGTRAEAEKLISEVSKEFKLGDRNITPEQLQFMVESRLNKVEKLAQKAKFEEKGTIKRTIKFGGMDVPLEIPTFGTSATEEIAKISGGKSPKEAVSYYRLLNQKIKKAISNINASDAKESNGYVQLAEREIQIPIKEAEKSKKLQWLEQQLKEKQNLDYAKKSHKKLACEMKS